MLLDIREGFEQELGVLCLVPDPVSQPTALHEFLCRDDEGVVDVGSRFLATSPPTWRSSIAWRAFPRSVAAIAAALAIADSAQTPLFRTGTWRSLG